MQGDGPTVPFKEADRCVTRLAIGPRAQQNDFGGKTLKFIAAWRDRLF